LHISPFGPIGSRSWSGLPRPSINGVGWFGHLTFKQRICVRAQKNKKTKTRNHNTKEIELKALGKRKRDYAILNTSKSIINNLCEGVVDGYTITMKIIFAHFPITVKTKDKEILVENFQGERAPRIARIHGATKVVSKGDEVVITGPVLTEVSQTAAEIQQKTRIKNKDHRVFLDGIYIESKSKGITNKK